MIIRKIVNFFCVIFFLITSIVHSNEEIQYEANLEKEAKRLKKETWFEAIFHDDDRGILVNMKKEVDHWLKQEEYVELWSIENTGVYRPLSLKEKKKFLARQTLKYFDRRMQHRIKTAEKGSTLEKVGKVEKALRPNARVQISKNFSLRFKARVLQGKALLLLNNPYIEWYAKINSRGIVNVTMSKRLSKIGLQAKLEYSSEDDNWVASISKKMTSDISVKFSSTQKVGKMFFGETSDQKFELFFSSSF